MKRVIARLTLNFIFLMFFLSVYCQQEELSDINNLFEMSLTDLLNQDIITSSKFHQSLSEAASSMSIITSDEIKSYHYSTLGEILLSQSGFYISNDRNYAYIGSRGFSRPTDYNNRIVVLMNGHMLNEVVYGSSFHDNSLGINPLDIERIEIIKGPGASLDGSGAMLNTINIILKDGRTGEGLRTTVEGGSFGLKTASASYGMKMKKGDLFIAAGGGLSKGEDFYFPELDSPETNNGVSQGLDWEKFGNMLAVFKTGSFTFSGSISSREKGIPTGAFETDLTGNPFTFDRRYFLESLYKKEFGKENYLQLRGYFDNYFYKGAYPSGGESIFDLSSGKWAGTELQYFTKAGLHQTIISGMEFKYIFRSDYKEWTDSATYFNKNSPYNSFSIYSHDQIEISSNLKLNVGLRYDYYSIFDHAISPRLSIVYNHSNRSALKLLYNEGFRIPNFYEAFYESVDCHKHNPNIKPEKIRTYEINFEHQFIQNLTGSFSVYSYDITNLIDQYLDENDGLTSFKNISKARGRGVETEINFTKENNLKGYLNITIQETRDLINKQILSNSPCIMIKSGMNIKAFNFFLLSPELYFETGRKTLTGQNTGDLFLLNFSAITKKMLNHLELSLKVKNLLDKRYYSPGGYEHSQDMIIQTGRSLSIKLSLTF